MMDLSGLLKPRLVSTEVYPEGRNASLTIALHLLLLLMHCLPTINYYRSTPCAFTLINALLAHHLCNYKNECCVHMIQHLCILTFLLPVYLLFFVNGYCIHSIVFIVINSLASGWFWGFSKKKHLNARGFAWDFLRSGMFYRLGKSLKRRGKSFSLHLKKFFCLWDAGFLSVTS